jgi:hypothetical protein
MPLWEFILLNVTMIFLLFLPVYGDRLVEKIKSKLKKDL